MPGNLQSIPLSVIASWPAPNYVDPQERTWMPVYAGILQGVMTAMLGTRFILRAQKKAGSLGLDDALLVPAFLAATMFTGVIILGTEKYGFSRHLWDVPPSLYEKTALIGWLAEFAFIISTCCTKVSVLLFYRRLTQETFDRVWKYATIGAVAFTVAYGLTFALSLILNCHPTDAYWKSYDPHYTTPYTCADTTVLNPLQGAISVISDVYSVFLPMAMLWHLDSTKRQKWALNGIFSLGLLVATAGIVRTYYLARLGTHYDITWLGFEVLVWSDLELQLAIICASAPALRVFFRRYLSDPIARAINSATGRSTIRESYQVECLGMVTYGEWENHDEQGDRRSGVKHMGRGVGNASPTPSEQVVVYPEHH